jgi:hypothetical protein
MARRKFVKAALWKRIEPLLPPWIVKLEQRVFAARRKSFGRPKKPRHTGAGVGAPL